MIDIVTVVFKEELKSLQVQAQSIEIYCQNLGIKNIFVIVNDDTELGYCIDPQWWGGFQHCVKIIHRENFGQDYVENGWVSQQVLKLLGASLSDNTWSMILDAKTIITNHVVPSIFIDPDNRYQLKVHPIMPVFQKSAEISGQLFDITVSEILEPSGVPFVFHNDTIREMISEISTRTNQNFLTWFQNQGMLTEFVLYSAFLQHKHGDLSVVSNQSNTHVLSNNICHSQVDIFDHRLNTAKHNQGLSIGVHRRAWQQLSNLQQQDYVDYLVSLGLDRAKILL